MSRSVSGRKGQGYSDPQKQADVGSWGDACSLRGEPYGLELVGMTRNLSLSQIGLTLWKNPSGASGYR